MHVAAGLVNALAIAVLFLHSGDYSTRVSDPILVLIGDFSHLLEVISFCTVLFLE